MFTSMEQDLHNKLINAALEIKKRPIRALFDLQPDRTTDFCLHVPPFYLDYSKQAIDDKIMASLLSVAEQKKITMKRNAMFQGEVVNNTENRAVLHTALRDTSKIKVHQPDTANAIENTKQRMLSFADKVNNAAYLGYSNKIITDVISIGIGGSFFGPKILESALTKYANDNIRIHYLANIDGSQVKQLLAKLNPEHCLIIVASKSWTTAETQLNAQAVMQWFKTTFIQKEAIEQHWIALTAKAEAAEAFGIKQEMIFPLWDFVGGRFSVWSAIGLPLAIKIGRKAFEGLLAGAAAMDQHFSTVPLAKNMPVIMALIGYWQQKYLDFNNLLVLPYSHSLRALPAYLQQLDMESNGKSVNTQGDKITHSGPLLWGAEGCNCQHSFLQLLHQGKQKSMIDFILPAKGEIDHPEHHNFMVANCLAQAQALMQGKTEQQAIKELELEGKTAKEAQALAKHKAMPGNIPSNTLILDEITPHSLGGLLALYEHKIFCQGILFDINSFDQWGVELGKALGKNLLQVIETGDTSTLDPSTRDLLAYINK